MNPSFSRFLTRNPAGFVEVATRWLDLLGGLFGALIVYALINFISIIGVLRFFEYAEKKGVEHSQ